MRSNDFLTTGQIATLLGVAPKTVSKWVDSGLLKGFRLPGSMDRRILKIDLDTFCVANQFPVPEQYQCKVALTRDRSAHPLLAQRGYTVVTTPFQLASHLGAFVSGKVLIDLQAGGRSDGLATIEDVRRLQRFTVLLVACEDEAEDLLALGLCQAWARRPLALEEWFRLLA